MGRFLIPRAVALNDENATVSRTSRRRCNPFAEEDAQTDPVFKDHCIDSTYHPTWDKIYGDPAEPATSIVFGEKGSGKTAMRLQIVRHLAGYNRQHPRQRMFVIEYDDFNPFLDRFRDRSSSRRGAATGCWPNGSCGITWTRSCRWASPAWSIASWTSSSRPTPPAPTPARSTRARLDRHQARDLLLLAACYDQSSAETTKGRGIACAASCAFARLRPTWRSGCGVGCDDRRRRR